MSGPRSSTSNSVWDQRDTFGCEIEGSEHYMTSIRVDSDLVQYVERCNKCGWVDPAALQWWAENAIKNSLSRRAQRIAVAAETQPFCFAQHNGEELSLDEILFQALGAASMCWKEIEAAGEFNSTRAKDIGTALLSEVMRFQRIAQAEALSQARQRLMALYEAGPLSKAEVLASIR